MSTDRYAVLRETLDLLAELRETSNAKIWARVLDKTAAALGAEGAVYTLHDTKAKKLSIIHAIGNEDWVKDPQPGSIGEGLCGWTAKFGEPLLVPDVAKDDRFRVDLDAAPGVAVENAMLLPLFVGLDLEGVFAFFNKSGGAFGADDLELAKIVVRETSFAVRRLKLEDMVNRVTAYNASILDNLSGGFVAVDLAGRIMICNPAARRILGIRAEVTDTAVEQALADVPELANILRRTLSSKKTAKRQDLTWESQGRRRILGYSTILIQDTQGAFAGAGVTFQDITNVKK